MMQFLPTRFFRVFWGLLFAVSFLASATPMAHAQLLRRIAGREEKIIADSHRCLNEIMEIPVKSIPVALFEKAEGIAIFPGLVKGSFIVGAQHGSGVLIVKNDNGKWEAPRFLEMTGGSVGFQAGIQAADIILIFCTRRSVEAAMSDQFTIGADASVAAGPLGRQASASTNFQLSSEIYSYSRSRGIFLGVALDGCVLNIDEGATQRYYANGITPSATNLVHLAAGYTQRKDAQNAEFSDKLEVEPDGNIFENGAAHDAGSLAQQNREATRRLLVTSHESLMKILEPEWRQWLALPPETLQPATTEEFAPSSAILTLQTRFQQIANDPKYTELAARPEFTQTKLLLSLYLGD